jgi:ATP-dependent Clp protease ATP-binding subunit ClpA
MFERFTERARQVVVLAQEEARRLQHNYIGPEHILLGLLREDRGLGAQALESLGVTLEPAREQLLRIVGPGEEPSGTQIPFTTPAKQVLELALRESLALEHNYIGTEHILLGLLRQNDGVAVRILLDCEVDLADLRDELIARTGGAYVPQGDEEISSGPGPAIDPGWLDGLPVLLKPLGEEIRSKLGRAPDLGDLLLVLVCVPHTPSAEALGELGLDADGLWGHIERARTDAETDRHALAKELTEVAQAKELAIEQGRLDEAAALRDQERELRARAKSIHWARLGTMTELRRRLGIPARAEDA